MPNHFSAIGFDVLTPDDIVALVRQVTEQAQAIPAMCGRYLLWTGGSGEELWLQTDTEGNLLGMNPHFKGESSVRVGLQGRVHRESDTPLDGAFHGWADPDHDKPNSGAYPLVFDAPDAALYSDLVLPVIAQAQIAAFAHEITFHESLDAYSTSQADKEVKFASQSFFPSGLFKPESATTETPEAVAIFTGHVVEACIRKNAISSASFYWALVDTLGGMYDVVVDPSLLAQVPFAGGMVSGTFWLSGRLTSYPRRKRTWFEKILGGAG